MTPLSWRTSEIFSNSAHAIPPEHSATTKEVFESYIEEVLAPTLGEGQVVVMDNLSSHKGEKVRELIEARGCELIYLPPYSPDFNPIEQAFS